MNDESTYVFHEWAVLSKEIAYENPWIFVEHCTVTQPSGAPGIYGIVRHRTPTVVVLTLDAYQQTCVVGQFRLPTGTFSWELPGGHVDLGEEPIEAAKRELLEEIGFTALCWQEMPPFNPSNGTSDEIVFPFVARELRQVAKQEVNLALEWSSFSVVYHRALNGGISDAASLVAILRAREFVDLATTS